MKLIPTVHFTEHEVTISDHLAMFGFDVIIKFKEDSIHYNLLKLFNNVTRIHWMQEVDGFSSKAVTVESFIHGYESNYESYDIEYIIIDMATKMSLPA